MSKRKPQTVQAKLRSAYGALQLVEKQNDDVADQITALKTIVEGMME